jgi:hypothetical protein
VLEDPSGNNYLYATSGGAVVLFHNAIVKLATTSTGIDVTGTVTATGTSVFASLDISGDIDVDGTTNLDVVDIDGAVDMASTLAVGGVVTANAGVVVDNFTLDGTTLALSSGDMTLDVAGDINLDSDSGYVLFKDAGTEHARIYQNNSGDVNIASQISDKDMKFNGNDGGTGITALTLDMSAAGAATFNAGMTVGGNSTFNAPNIDIKADDARLLIEEADGTDIVWLGDITGEGVGGCFLYNHGGTATTQLRADSASTIGHGLTITGTAEADNIYAGATGLNTLIVSFPNTSAYPNGSTYSFTLSAGQAPVGSRVILSVWVQSGSNSGDQYGFLAQNQSKGGGVRCFVEGWYWSSSGSSIFKIDNSNDRVFTFAHGTITATTTSDSRTVYYHGYIMDN